MADLVVGLTGGLASGKSTVARLLTRPGITVVDADQLVAELYAPGQPGAELVAQLLGEEALDPTGAVDRTAVAARVFRDTALRRALEAGIHPLVRQRFEAHANAANGIVVLEAALLVETGWGAQLDRLITVEAPRAVRIERATERDGSREEAERRIAAQAPESVRRQAADYVIENDGDLDHLRRQVEHLVTVLRTRSEEPAAP